MFDESTEMALEKKYTCVLSHMSLKNVLNNYPVDGRAVGAAIKAYCKEEETRVPNNFIDAEVFANDVYDHWIDAKPGYHEGREYEPVLEAIKRYLAFKFIWKSKVNGNSTITPLLQLQAADMLAVKGAIGGAIMAAHKHTKADPRLRPGELAETMELAFQTFIPIIHKLQTNGEFEDKRVEHIATKIVEYIDSETFKQLEYECAEKAIS